MKKLGLVIAAFFVACAPGPVNNPEVARWEQQAQQVTIIRDDWGIPHVYGKTDADAVFGLVYAQAEDDFNRIEVNYLNAQGRLAEAEGESEIYRDLRMKLFVNPDTIKAQFAQSPEWLKVLMTAWADGLNYYLHKNPQVTPRVLTRFEPWMALTFSEGSIGGDVEDVSLRELQAFYGDSGATLAVAADVDEEPRGSNGIAVAPANTTAKRALLLINPHTSFFFREEAQAVSEEGLNAYGAITWGQFFIYQGFNDKTGWMHTSSGADVVDEFAESVVKRGDSLMYKFGREERAVTVETIPVPYKSAAGGAVRTFTVYRTHHGPVVRKASGKWISVALMQEPVKALEQSFSRTKAKNLKEFIATMDLHTNSSNNTLYADADGNIAYLHANHVPKRATTFDWSQPVDGSNLAASWNGVHSVDESPNAINPPNGWVQNTNNWPYSAAGENSPKRANYPAYMDAGTENPRGIHAIRVLKDKRDFTIASLIAAAYDPYLPAMADLVPGVVAAYDKAPASHPLKAKLAEQVSALRGWDYRWAETSVATSLGVFWGDELWRRVSADAESEDLSVYEFIARRTTGEQKLEALAAASDKLTADFGKWNTPWGDINRFQRLTGDIVQQFDDAKPSAPVAFTSARWGSLASFGARAYPQTKKLYGTSGNSFVAVVEFGDSVRARAVTAGGLDSRPNSKHFNDQAIRYGTGDLREVYFYRSQLVGHTEREYHPGR